MVLVLCDGKPRGHSLPEIFADLLEMILPEIWIRQKLVSVQLLDYLSDNGTQELDKNAPGNNSGNLFVILLAKKLEDFLIAFGEPCRIRTSSAYQRVSVLYG